MLKISWRQRPQHPPPPHTHTHTHTHTQRNTHTRARADWQMCNTYYFSTAIMIRERASVLRYTYIDCVVYFSMLLVLLIQLLLLMLRVHILTFSLRQKSALNTGTEKKRSRAMISWRNSLDVAILAHGGTTNDGFQQAAKWAAKLISKNNSLRS